MANVIPMNWREVIQHKTAVEAGYVNNPNDLGKATNHGITQVTAMDPAYVDLRAKHNWNGDMRTLPVELAFDIYKRGWWDRMLLDEVAKRSMPLAERLFDFGINAGRANAVKSFQMLLNSLNKAQSLYPDLVIDGGLGKGTISALEAYLAANRNNRAAVEQLTLFMFAAQSWHYVNISLSREANEEFTNGWKNRVWNDFIAYATWLTP